MTESPETTKKYKRYFKTLVYLKVGCDVYQKYTNHKAGKILKIKRQNYYSFLLTKRWA